MKYWTPFLLLLGISFNSIYSTPEIERRFLRLGGERIINLEGNWSFQRGTDQNKLHPQPHAWRPVSVPQTWDQYDGIQDGFGWYGLDLELESDHYVVPSLLIHFIDDNYKLFVNDRLIHTQGIAGSDENHSTISVRRNVIPIGQMDPGKKVYRIRLQVSSFDGSGGGIRSKIYAGELKSITFLSDIRLFIISFTSGMFFIFGLHQLILYAYQRQDSSFFYFALFSISFSIFILFEDDLYYLISESPSYSWLWNLIWLLNRVVLLLFFFEFMLRFLRIRMKYTPWIVRLSAIFLVVFLITARIPEIVNRMYFVFTVYYIITAVFIVSISLIRLLYKSKIPDYLAITGAFLFIIAALYGSFGDTTQHNRLIIVSLGFGSMALLFSGTMGLKYSAIYKELNSLNDSLDVHVKGKTRELGSALDKLNSDLGIARRFQEGFLPVLNKTTLDTGFQYLPYQQVSGDLLDICNPDPYVERIFIADATGHGIHASLATMVIRLFYDRLKFTIKEPDALMQNLRDMLADEYPDVNLHFTGFLIDINRSTGLSTYCTAGHPAQYIVKLDGTVLSLKTRGTLVSRHFNKGYSSDSLFLQRGDRIVLFTDGLLEARNPNGEFFGEQNFIQCLMDTRKESAENQSLLVVNQILDYTQGPGFDDDVTLFIGEKTVLPSVMSTAR